MKNNTDNDGKNIRNRSTLKVLKLWQFTHFVLHPAWSCLAMDIEPAKINVKTLQNYNSPCFLFIWQNFTLSTFYLIHPSVLGSELFVILSFSEFSDIIIIATASAVSAVVL